jgi:hypothetical protein
MAMDRFGTRLEDRIENEVKRQEKPRHTKAATAVGSEKNALWEQDGGVDRSEVISEPTRSNWGLKGNKWMFRISIINRHSHSTPLFASRPNSNLPCAICPFVHPATQMSEDITNKTGKRAQYNRRFVNVTLAPGGKRRM